jgi:hypothetical protein
MWLLIVQAEYGEYQFIVQAKTRPRFEDFWTSEEPVSSHRWVELTTSTTTPEYTAWLLS